MSSSSTTPSILPVFDMATPAGQAGFKARLNKLRATTASNDDAAKTVSTIIEDVRRDGDAALVSYMRRWTNPEFTIDHIRVTSDELTDALNQLNQSDPTMRDTLQSAIDHVHAYQSHICPTDPAPITIDNATLGLRWTPIDRVGLAIPGGRAAYPSTVIMLAVPALAAGVKPQNIHIVSPPPTVDRDDSDDHKDHDSSNNKPDRVPDISPLVLGVCAMLGLTNVYRIGGAQAIAALAYGTDTVPPVDLIVGPGNVYTQLAKQQLAGTVGIDGFLGPSEIVTIADQSADPACVAADLIAQAEHDPGKCFLIAWEFAVLERILNQVNEQLLQRNRTDAIRRAFADESAAVLASDRQQAIDLTNRLAAEHVNLAVDDPQAMLPAIGHAGEIFLGDQTPVAAGDYYAGPSHCLPTGTTARFASGISAYTFLKRTGTVAYPPSPQGMSTQTIDAIAKLAEAEGLDGHAASVRIRAK